jgi:perosamine synthetase
MKAYPERIPVAGPSITAREAELCAEAALDAWYADHYKYNARFERMVAEFCGVKHAVSLPHCTAALHLALAAAGVGPGDEVIVPDVTWIASVAPVTYVGATPVLVESRTDTWCIDPAAVEDAICPATKAIIGVDLYGSMCDWDALTRISERHRLLLVEDAAEAIGSEYQGRRAGAFGRAAAFSFHGSKTVATGEGGMLVTNDDALRERVLFLRDHGRDPGDRYFQNTEIGFKYRMNGVTAALGCAQMERIDELIEQKRRIFHWYRERLEGHQTVVINAEPAGVKNSYWMVTACVDPALGLDKFALMARMAQCNVDTRPFFSPLSTLPAFEKLPQSKRFCRHDSPMARLSAHAINLPSGYNMDEEKVDFVCAALLEIVDAAG